MIGKRLRELREQNKKSREEIAQELNISLAAYAHYENNFRQPPIENLIKLADYYNVSLDFLVGRSVKKVNDVLDIIDINGIKLKTGDIKKIKEIIDIISKKSQ